MTGVEQFFFYLFGLVALASALLFVTRKSPVAAALWLVGVMFSLAALYVMMDAQFVGAVQVLVYAGAIMVVFLFVVMLLNLGQGDARADFRSNATRIAGGLVGLALLAELLVVARSRVSDSFVLSAATFDADANAGGPNVIAPVASALFTRHLIAFEVTSLLLLAAVVGAVVLAKRGREV